MLIVAGHLVLDLADRDAQADVEREAAPLADGWEQRVGLWQLFPLLVHAVLFGGSYGRRVGELAGRHA